MPRKIFPRYNNLTPEELRQMKPSERLKHFHHRPLVITQEQADDPQTLHLAKLEARRHAVPLMLEINYTFRTGYEYLPLD